MSWYWETLGTPAFGFGLVCGFALAAVLWLHADYQDFAKRLGETEGEAPSVVTKSKRVGLSRWALLAVVGLIVIANTIYLVLKA